MSRERFRQSSARYKSNQKKVAKREKRHAIDEVHLYLILYGIWCIIKQWITENELLSFNDAENKHVNLAKYFKNSHQKISEFFHWSNIIQKRHSLKIKKILINTKTFQKWISVKLKKNFTILSAIFRNFLTAYEAWEIFSHFSWKFFEFVLNQTQRVKQSEWKQENFQKIFGIFLILHLESSRKTSTVFSVFFLKNEQYRIFVFFSNQSSFRISQLDIEAFFKIFFKIENRICFHCEAITKMTFTFVENSIVMFHFFFHFTSSFFSIRFFFVVTFFLYFVQIIQSTIFSINIDFFKLTLSFVSFDVLNRIFRLYDFKLIIEIFWLKTYSNVEIIVVSFIINVRRFVKKIENFRHKIFISNWSKKWSQSIFFVKAIKNFNNVIKQYRKFSYFQIFVRRNQKSKFSKKKYRSFTSLKSFFLSLINSFSIYSYHSISRIVINRFFTLTFTSIFRRRINEVITVEKIILHDFIEFQLLNNNIDNIINVSLNSIVQIIVNRVVQNVLKIYIVNFSTFQRNERKKSKFSKLQNNVDANDDNIDNNNIFFNRWNSSNFDFFDSLYESKFVVFEIVSLKHNDKKFYFKNVHIFVDRIKELIVIKKAKWYKKIFDLIFVIS